MKALDHPSIVTLAEVMETEQTLDPVTEYASGEDVRLPSWSQWHERGGPGQILPGSAVQYCNRKFTAHVREDKKPAFGRRLEHQVYRLRSYLWLDTCVAASLCRPETLSRVKVRSPWGGCVEPKTYTLIRGSLCFGGQNFKQQEEGVLSGIDHFPPTCP